MTMLCVEQLEDRLTPAVCVLTPPGEPTPATCLVSCIHESITGVLADADAAVVTALAGADAAALAIEEQTDVDVESFVWGDPPVNPFVAMYAGLDDYELYLTACTAKAKALDLLAQVQVIQGHNYSGVSGWAQAAADAVQLPWLFLSLQEVRLEIQAITQIHNSR